MDIVGLKQIYTLERRLMNKILLTNSEISLILSLLGDIDYYCEPRSQFENRVKKLTEKLESSLKSQTKTCTKKESQ